MSIFLSSLSVFLLSVYSEKDSSYIARQEGGGKQPFQQL
jgi:hypothetical protein